MQNDLSLVRVQNIISVFESIFYVPQDKKLELSKLHTESHHYDSTYETAVRRKELAHIILLDEILYVRHLSHLETADLIHDLEKVVFSPDFYRDLVFGRPIADFEPQFTALQENIAHNIETFNTMVSGDTYKELSGGFLHFSPPENKDKFMAELVQVDDFLSAIQHKLFKKVEPGVWLEAAGAE